MLSRRGGYDWRAYGVSLFDFVARIGVTLFVPLSIASPLIGWVEQHRLATLRVDSVGTALLLFITLEFFYYWLHRAGHRLRWSSSTACSAPASLSATTCPAATAWCTR